MVLRSVYRDPVFSSKESNELVHELILILAIIEKDIEMKYLTAFVLKLIFFFSTAYKNGQQIRSESD